LAESYDLPFHNLAIILPSSFWPLLVHNLIMLPSSASGSSARWQNLTIYLHDLHHAAVEPLALPPVGRLYVCPFMISPSCCRRGFGFFRLLADSCGLPGSAQTPFNLSIQLDNILLPWLCRSSLGLGAIGEQENLKLVHDSRSSLRSLTSKKLVAAPRLFQLEAANHASKRAPLPCELR
jgi:hypothetical protein